MSKFIPKPILFTLLLFGCIADADNQVLNANCDYQLLASSISEQMNPNSPVGFAILDTQSWFQGLDQQQLLQILKAAGSEALNGKRPKILQFDYTNFDFTHDVQSDWILNSRSSSTRAPEIAENLLFTYAKQIEVLLNRSQVDGLELRVLGARMRVENIENSRWSLRDLFTNLLHTDGPHMNVTTSIVGPGTRVKMNGDDFHVRERDTLINSGTLRAQEILGVVPTVHAIPRSPTERVVFVLRVYAFRDGRRILAKPENRSSLWKTIRTLWSLNR